FQRPSRHVSQITPAQRNHSAFEVILPDSLPQLSKPIIKWSNDPVGSHGAFSQRRIDTRSIVRTIRLDATQAQKCRPFTSRVCLTMARMSVKILGEPDPRLHSHPTSAVAGNEAAEQTCGVRPKTGAQQSVGFSRYDMMQLL